MKELQTKIPLMHSNIHLHLHRSIKYAATSLSLESIRTEDKTQYQYLTAWC